MSRYKPFVERTPEQRERKLAENRACYWRHRDELRARTRERWAERVALGETQAGQRRSMLRRAYGIEPEQYDAMLARQGGGCAICQANEPGRGQKHFHVDHDHVTNAVRGLLCGACNSMLGMAGDAPTLLRIGEAYLLEAA